MDDVITLIYPGLEFVAYKTNPAQGGSRQLHVRTTVSAAKYTAKHGLSLGTSSDQVRIMLGAPTSEESGVLVYRENDFTRLELYFHGGRLRKIEKLSFPD